MDTTPTRKAKVDWRSKVRMRKCNESEDLSESVVRRKQNHKADSKDTESDSSPGITGEFFRNIHSSPTVSWDFIRPEASETVRNAAKRLSRELHEHRIKRRKFQRTSKCIRGEAVILEAKDFQRIPVDQYRASLSLFKSRLDQYPSQFGDSSEVDLKRNSQNNAEEIETNRIDTERSDPNQAREILNDSFDELMASASEIIEDICKSGSDQSAKSSGRTVDINNCTARDSRKRCTETIESRPCSLIKNPELYDDNDDLFNDISPCFH